VESLLSVAVGIALAAACGFRVFVPLLVVSLAAATGHLELSERFAWMGTWPACLAFGIATAAEVAAYYIPWVDNLLDSVASPAAVVAGVMVTGAVIADMSPFLRWSLAIIAGGGVAGLVQGATVSTRATSSALTGGTANSAFATFEAGGAFVTAILAIAVPVLAGAVLLLIGLLLWKRASRSKPPQVAAP